MKKFTVLLLLVALFATSCDSLWENVYEKPVSIRFTIPSEMLDSYAQENALRAAQGGEDNFARAGVYTGISAKVSIHDTTNDKVYSEKSLEIGDSLDDTITFDNLYIVGKTVYAQVELSQFGYETRTQRSETITVIEGYNEVALEFEDAIEQKYILTFDAKGGVVDVSEKEVTFNSIIGEIPIANKVGEDFSGWEIDGTIINENTVWSYAENKTAVALWGVSTYTVTFDQNYPSKPADTTQQALHGSNLARPADPDRANYTFGGWYRDSAASGAAWNFDTDTVTEDMTLYAKWTANEFTLTYNADGGNVSPSSKVVTYDQAIGDLPTPTRTGYTFGRWEIGGVTIDAGTNWNYTENKTALAIWTAETYTLTFDAAGGSGGTSSKNVTYDQAIGAITPPTREGYNFNGWQIGGTTITDATIWNYTSNQTAVAQWTIETYTITFNANGGSGSMPTQSFTYGVSKALSSNTYTAPAGNRFLGWATTSGASVAEYTNGEDYSAVADDTLFAVWTTTPTPMTATLSGDGLTLTVSPDSASSLGLKGAMNAELGVSSRSSITSVIIEPPADGSKILPETDLSELFYWWDEASDWDSLLTITGLDNLDTSGVTDMSDMFNTQALTSLDVSGFDTTNVTTMANMFNTCAALTTLDLSSFDTSNVTDMSGMFYFLSKIQTLTFGSLWNTQNVTTMSGMFQSYAFTSKTPLPDFTLWNTSSVTDMSQMFYGSNYTTLDVSTLNTDNVENMEQMFAESYALTSLDISGWDTSNVTSCSGMFASPYLKKSEVTDDGAIYSAAVQAEFDGMAD